MYRELSKLTASIAITFRSLKYKNFRYYWIGQCVSVTGTYMQRTAQTWLVYTLTKSPFMVGILGVCQFLPMLLFSLFAGVIVDRFPKKRILLVTQTAFMLQALIMAFLTFTGQIQYWHVFILCAVFGVTQTIDMPARQSFFYELVGREDIMNAVSLNSTAANLARIVGPALAGLAMVTLGPVICFFGNALSYVAVIIGILMIRVAPRVTQVVRSPMLQKVMEGLRYIKNNEVLMINVILMGGVCTFAMNNDVVIPVFASVALGSGATGYSILLASAGVGAFIGAIFMAFISKNGLHKNYLIISGVATAVLQILTIFTRQYVVCMLMVATVGFFNLVFINTGNSTFQLNSSNEYRGRVMSVYTLLNQGSTPIGNFFAGTVMEHFGGAVGFLGCGIMTLLIFVPVIIFKHKTIAGWMTEPTKV